MFKPPKKPFLPEHAEVVIRLYDEGILLKWLYWTGPRSCKTVTDNGVLSESGRTNEYGADHVVTNFKVRPAETSAREWHFEHVRRLMGMKNAEEGTLWIRPFRGMMKLGWDIIDQHPWTDPKKIETSIRKRSE